MYQHMSPADWAEVLAVVFAAIGLFLLWWQVRKQTTQHFSDRVLDLYHELDARDAREDRKFVYTEFPLLSNPDKAQVDRVREVVSSMDRMSYQVLRGYADRQAAYDIYGRVLTRVVFSTWDWVAQERAWRNDPPRFRYCRYAEALALQFAEYDLKAIHLWRPSDGKLGGKELLRKAVAWSSASRLVELNKTTPGGPAA